MKKTYSHQLYQGPYLNKISLRVLFEQEILSRKMISRKNG